MTLKLTCTSSKPLSTWSNRDFLLFFSQKLKLATGKELDIPPLAWQAFMGRIKGFRTKLHLSNEQYYVFINNVFDKLVQARGHVPVFGAVVSEQVYNVLTRYATSSHASCQEDFVAVREKLYRNHLLFAKVVA